MVVHKSFLSGLILVGGVLALGRVPLDFHDFLPGGAALRKLA